LVLRELVLGHDGVVLAVGRESLLGEFVVVAIAHHGFDHLVGLVLAAEHGRGAHVQAVLLRGDVDAAAAVHVVDRGAEVLVEVERDHAVVVGCGHVGLAEEDLAAVLLLDAPVGDVGLVGLDVGGHVVLCFEEHGLGLLALVDGGSRLVGPDLLADGAGLRELELLVEEAEHLLGLGVVGYSQKLGLGRVGGVLAGLDHEGDVLDFGVEFLVFDRTLEPGDHGLDLLQGGGWHSLADLLEPRFDSTQVRFVCALVLQVDDFDVLDFKFLQVDVAGGSGSCGSRDCRGGRVCGGRGRGLVVQDHHPLVVDLLDFDLSQDGGRGVFLADQFGGAHCDQTVGLDLVDVFVLVDFFA